MNNYNVLREFLSYLKPHWKKNVLVFIMVVIASICMLIPPYIIKYIIDDVFPSKNMNRLLLALAGFLSIYLVKVIAEFLMNYFNTQLSNQVILTMRSNIFYRLLKLPVKFFHDRKLGDVVHRLSHELYIIQVAITTSSLRFLYNILAMLGLAIVLFYVNWKLTLTCVVILPFIYLNIKFFQPKIQRITGEIRKKDAKIISFLTERLNQINLIKSYDRYQWEKEKIVELNKELNQLELKSIFFTSGSQKISSFLLSLTTVILYGVGGFLFFRDETTLGTLIAFSHYLILFLSPFQNLMNLYIHLLKAISSMHRVFELRKEVTEYELFNKGKQKVKNIDELQDCISLKDITYSYDNQYNILSGCNINFYKNKKYALVGPSGVGKSSIIKLICGFYPLKKGSILLDDIPIEEIDLKSIRSLITYVGQENQSYNTTIRESIRYGNLEATDEQVQNICEKIGLWEQIKNLKNGLDTIIGDSSVKISGGQRQRVSIARALLRNPKVLILDEATNALDIEAEKRLFEFITNSYNLTLIIITHRFHSLHYVDEVLCLDKGKIVEQGTIYELNKRKGFFWRLFKDQV